MATKKISELEAVTTAEDNDVLVLVDVSEGTTNKITKGNLLLSSGNQIEIDSNSETYQLVFKLKNSVGTVLSTATIDLPSENAITKIEYDQGELKITKQSGSIETVDISGLINGLVTESDFNTFKTQLQQTIQGIQETIGAINVKNLAQDEEIEANYNEITKLKQTVQEQQNIINQLPPVEGEGTEVTLDKTIKSPFTKFEIEGNSEQETRSYKGLFRIPEALSQTINGLTFKVNNDGSVTVTGTSTDATTIDLELESPVVLNGTYTFSIKRTGTGGASDQQWILYKGTLENKQSLGLNPGLNGNVTNTVEATATILRVFTANAKTINCTIYPILEEGSTVTDWDVAETHTTPNPDYEQPIKSSGDNGSITEKIVNKNLWSSVWEQGYINANGVNENNSDLIRTKDYIYFEPEQKYAIKRSIATAYTNVRGYDKNKRFIGTGRNVIVSYSGGIDNPMQATIQTCVIATKPGVYYLRFNDASNNLSTEYMMVKGDTPTDYVPHKEQTYSIPVQQPMRSIGNVRDVFFKNTKDSEYYDENLVENGWYERHYIGREIFDGTETIINEASLSDVNRYIFSINGVKSGNALSNYYKYLANYTSNTEHFYTGNNQIIVFHSNTITSGTNYKTWLAEQYANETPMYIDYPLAEPLDLPCTEEQIEVLENPPKTYAEQTNIYSEDEVRAYLKAKGIYDIKDLVTRVEVLESQS